jgi:hypothetical protein
MLYTPFYIEERDKYELIQISLKTTFEDVIHSIPNLEANNYVIYEAEIRDSTTVGGNSAGSNGVGPNSVPVNTSTTSTWFDNT